MSYRHGTFNVTVTGIGGPVIEGKEYKITCKHSRAQGIGRGTDHIAVAWCPDCGSIKRTDESRWKYCKLSRKPKVRK